MADLDALRNQKKKQTDTKNSISIQKSRPTLSIGATDWSRDAEHHYHLGRCYDCGLEGFPVDCEKAIHEYLAAAELGHPKAMVEVSNVYSDGEYSILGNDPAKAETWARKAIQCGNMDGYKCLFAALENQGKGQEAVRQLEAGAAKGNLDCIEWLAFLHYWGLEVAGYEVEEDEDRAFALLTSVNLDNGHAVAFGVLGNIYRDREDYADAVKCYEKALEIVPDYNDVMAELGIIYRTENEFIDYPKARKLLTLAARNGNLRAMNSLAVMLYLAEGGEQEENVALDWFRKAAEGGLWRAMLNLYDMLSDENPEEAMYWLKRAADDGSEEAQSKLEELQKGVPADSSISDKVYEDQLADLQDTLKLSPYSFPGKIAGIQKVIDEGHLSVYEADRLRLLQGLMSLVYFKEHFCDDDFDDLSNRYYEILDKVDDFVGRMSSVTEEAVYLYDVANMYSAARFKDVDPCDKLKELWSNVQSIKLDESTTEFKVSYWEEMARDAYDLMSKLLGLDSQSSNSQETSCVSNDKIRKKVVEMIADLLCVDEAEISMHATLTDLGGDSLDAVDLIMKMEKEFRLIIPDEDAMQLQTVGDIISYIEDRTM